ncbi:MAG: FecR domain-containing protein [Bacteroidales bacterium]|nr:FecR domain-containing protein [Bacteroidales bacterium]
MDTVTPNNDIEILLLRYISGDSSKSEREQILAWIRENSKNAQELVDLRYNLHIIEKKKKYFDTEKAITTFESKTQPKKNVSIKQILIYASSIAALILLLFAINIFISKDNTLNLLASTTESTKDIVLSDGSMVTLNKKSKLSSIETFEKTNRKLLLEGEAFFEVAPDKANPFEIKVKEVTVKVLGTAFNIFSDSLQNVVVTVKSGRVEVSYNNQIIYINQGEQVTFSGIIQKISKSNFDIANSDAWKTGQLIFSNTTLKEVVASINKNMKGKFYIATPEIESRKINAKFDYDDSLKDVEEILTVVLGVEIKNDTIYQTSNIEEYSQ